MLQTLLPAGLTDTTLRKPASSSDSLSISPSTMMTSLQPAMSSRPYSTFSAPLTCVWGGEHEQGVGCLRSVSSFFPAWVYAGS